MSKKEQGVDGLLKSLRSLEDHARATDQKVLDIATGKLAEVEKQIEAAAVEAKCGGAEAEAAYQQLILDRGKLQQVIQRAEQHLKK